MIPKGHQKGRWRLILDLSHPEGKSVNSGTDQRICSLVYTSVDSAARQIVSLGRGTHLAKLDLESAYRMLPIHPDDQPLLGMKWRDRVWIDTTLPFGLRSAPKIFNVMADCLQWILENKGSCKVIHYLDDFLFMGEPGSQQCGESLQLALNTCQRLGVRVSMEKLEGPSTQISFLGIMLDTERLEVRLPEEKMARLAEAIAEWRGNRSCTKRELLSPGWKDTRNFVVRVYLRIRAPINTMRLIFMHNLRARVI